MKGGKPVGGVEKITVKKGDRLRFTVTSDVADEIHVHGYDFKKEVPAGGTVRFDFPAQDRRQLRGRARAAGRADRIAAGRAVRRRITLAWLLAPARRWWRAALLPEAASAHGLVGRTDLPIPSWLFGWAAAIVLIVSFAALATLWPKPRLQEVSGGGCSGMPRVVDRSLGAIGIGLFVLVVYSGLAGDEGCATANFAPTFIYVHFWVGLVVLSVLFGDVFRAFNPWRAIGRARRWAWAGGPRDRDARPLDVSRRLGRWPAVLGILGFAWLELAYMQQGRPQRQLAMLALGYAASSSWGWRSSGSRPGASAATPSASTSTSSAGCRLFDGRDRTLYLRPPLSGAPRWPLCRAASPCSCAAIGSTTFDGFSNGPVWALDQPDIQRFFSHLGAGGAQRPWAVDRRPDRHACWRSGSSTISACAAW